MRGSQSCGGIDAEGMHLGVHKRTMDQAQFFAILVRSCPVGSVILLSNWKHPCSLFVLLPFAPHAVFLFLFLSLNTT